MTKSKEQKKAGSVVDQKLRVSMPAREAGGPESRALVDTILRESDRGMLLVTAAHLEVLLGELLAKTFVDDASLRETLLHGDRPLSTFSARTKVVFALGLIDRATYQTLNGIRDMRNAAAHQEAPVLTEDRNAIIAKLPILSRLPGLRDRDIRPRDLFAIASMLAAGALIHQVKCARHVSPPDYGDPPEDIDDYLERFPLRPGTTKR